MALILRVKPAISLDRIRGMFMGAFLGDALGAPTEFRCNSRVPYTGKLEFVPFYISQYQGRKEGKIGGVTDDSELTLALLRILIQDGGYNREHVIQAYLAWANSGNWMMGKNTRTLLKGVTTIKSYQTRINKILELPMDQRSQSNGSLMRCSPLALLFDNQCVIEDTHITNPHPVNVDCSLIYVNALRLALQGYDGSTIFNIIKPLAQTEAVKAVLSQVERRELRNIVTNKGWCLHALWCTFMVITSDMNYTEAMHWIITSQRGSDSDTNACIAGALLGAVLGFERLQIEQVENIQILLSVDNTAEPNPRPREYSPHDFFTLTEAAHRLTL